MVLLMVCVNEREREEGGGEGGGGRRGEGAFTRTDQEYITYIEDESGGRGLLADKLR